MLVNLSINHRHSIIRVSAVNTLPLIIINRNNNYYHLNDMRRQLTMKINVKATGINIQQQGSGEMALVFLHYYGGSSRTWSKVINQLPDHFRTIAIDLRGWGSSDAPATGYRLEDLARDVEGVITALGLKRYVLVGHSMGGKIAQLMASRRPDGLQGLLLVAPSPPSPMRLTLEQRNTLSSAYQSRESVNFVIDNVLTAGALDPLVREEVIEDSLRGSSEAKKGWPDMASGEDITQEVGAINVPVKVISGELDRVDSPATLQKTLMPLISQASIHIIPGVGHLLPLEAPDEVASHLSTFAFACDVCPSTPQAERMTE
jgi:pimeloyl-ACP methyl ester carboxylesterase